MIKYLVEQRCCKNLFTDQFSDIEKWILGYLTIAEFEHIPEAPHSGGGGSSSLLKQTD